MAVAFDATGAGQNGGGGSATNMSFAHTAAFGADVFLGILVDRNIAPSSVQYNGSSMTLVGSQLGDNSSSFGGITYLYRAAGAGTGSSANLTASFPSCWWSADSVSYTGVGSVGSPIYTYGQSTSPSTGSVSCTAGQMILALVGTCDAGQASTLGSPTGGTNRYLCAGVAADTTGSSGLDISDSTSTATFAATTSGSGTPCWSTVSVVMSAATGGPYTASPTTATVAITGGAQSPLSRVLYKLGLGQSTTIQVIGDSTAWGQHDAGDVESGSPWTPGTLCGWPGRLALALGTYFNATVKVYVWNYPANTGYASPVALNTGSGGSPPTITVYLGGWPGATCSNYLGALSAMLPAPNADVVIYNSGFNELVASTYATNTVTFVQDVQSTYCPTAPILLTTENATTIANESGHGVTFAQLFATLIDTFISSSPSQPLSPALQQSNVYGGVWLLDTQQAGQNASTLYTDGLHPIAPGYAEQAQFMLNQLTQLPGVVADSGLMLPTSATVTITGDTPNVQISGPYVASPTSATVTITGSVPTITNENPLTNFTVTGNWSSQGNVSGTVYFTPSPASAGSVATATISGGTLSATLPIISGVYSVSFVGVTLNGITGTIESFAFASPQSAATVNLNTIVSPAPLVSTAVSPPSLAPISYAAAALPSPLTLTNSTTSTPLVSLTLGPNQLQLGSTFRTTVRGTVATASTSGTLTFTPYVGPNASTETFAMASETSAQSAAPFFLQLDATVTNTGSSGLYVVHGYGRIEFATPVVLSTTTLTTAAVDTTQSTANVAINAQWGTASASNILTVQTATVERIV